MAFNDPREIPAATLGFDSAFRVSAMLEENGSGEVIERLLVRERRKRERLEQQLLLRALQETQECRTVREITPNSRKILKKMKDRKPVYDTSRIEDDKARR